MNENSFHKSIKYQVDADAFLLLFASASPRTKKKLTHVVEYNFLIYSLLFDAARSESKFYLGCVASTVFLRGQKYENKNNFLLP